MFSMLCLALFATGFDSYFEEAKERGKKGEWTQEASPFVDAIRSAPSKEEFEGDEAQFHPEFLHLPLQEHRDDEEEKTVLKTCEEAGSYGRLFRQTLIVKKNLANNLKQCQKHFHEFLGEVKSKDQAKLKKKGNKRKKELQNQFEADPFVQKGFLISCEEHKYHWDFFADFTHVDDAPGCSHFALVEIAAPSTEDEWQTDSPTQLDAVRKNPNCHLACIQAVEGAGVRTVDGKKIFRDVWSRDLLFRCEPDELSPCDSLRKEGGVLVQKRCLRTDAATGECELWEKTFDVGAKKFSNGAKIGEISGLHGEFDATSGKNHDLPKVLSVFALLSDLPKGEGKNLLGMDEKTQIFNGETQQCRKNHNIHELYDCCKKTGLFAGHCEDAELEVQKLVDEGRCHYVGHWTKKGWKDKIWINEQTTKVYCCFPTKLLRIFNEKARRELGIGWGSAKSPNCNGFSLEEMDGKIDFSKMNVVETIEEFGVNEETVMQEMKKKIGASLANPDARKEVFDEGLFQ